MNSCPIILRNVPPLPSFVRDVQRTQYRESYYHSVVTRAPMPSPQQGKYICKYSSVLPVSIIVFAEFLPHNSKKCTTSPILSDGCPQNTIQGVLKSFCSPSVNIKHYYIHGTQPNFVHASFM